MNLIQKVREFMQSEKIDYLLVNSTNEFLVEYSALSENSRYFLTGFSGSTGDALLSQKNLFLFVDGRYHEQADSEANKDTTVIKMKLNQSFSECLDKKIKKNKESKTLAIAAKKNSQGRLEILENLLLDKNISIRLLDFDPVINFLSKEADALEPKIEQISNEIAGLSADEKFKIISAKIKSKEAILTTNLEEVSYLCNLRDFSKNYASQIEAKCLIMRDFSVLFSDKPVKEFSEKFKIMELGKFEDYIKGLDKIDKIYVDKINMSAFDYSLLADKAGFLDKNYLKEMKSVKTEAEIEHYKTCFERTDKALNEVREYILSNKNLSECDITEKLEEAFYRWGAKALSFKSIVAKDANSALAHYSKCSKDEILKDGSLVLIDCGAYYEGGYATDCTRVFVKGESTKLQMEVYTCVLKSFLAAFNKKITTKTSGFSLDKTARKILGEIAPKGFAFSHALGHGIGISVHEAPPSLGLSPLAKTPLKPNMCFTIEPGLYNPKRFGVRLENSCYMAEEGDKLTIKSFSNMCFEKKLIDFELLSSREKKWLKTFEVK